MIKGTVILQYIDRKTGIVLHRIKKHNVNTPAGLDLYWRFFTSQVTELDADDNPIEFRLQNSSGAGDPYSAARLRIEQYDPDNASEFILAANIDTLDLNARLVIDGGAAKIVWRWTDDVKNRIYVPARLNFSRNDTEGLLARITSVPADNWPVKEEGVDLQVTWEASLESRAGVQGGGMSDNVVVAKGLQEFLRPIIQATPFPLKLSALSGRLTTKEAVGVVGPEDDGREALPDIPLSFTGWEMHADNNDVPLYSVRTTATLDFTDFMTGDQFEAGAFELSITVGGDPIIMRPEETFVFYVEQLLNSFDVNAGTNWSRTFTMGLVNK